MSISLPIKNTIRIKLRVNSNKKTQNSPDYVGLIEDDNSIYDVYAYKNKETGTISVYASDYEIKSGDYSIICNLTEITYKNNNSNKIPTHSGSLTSNDIRFKIVAWRKETAKGFSYTIKKSLKQ